jgi:hypothetical protein
MYREKAFDPGFNSEYKPLLDINNYIQICYCKSCCENLSNPLSPDDINKQGIKYMPSKNETIIRWNAIKTNLEIAKNINLLINKNVELQFEHSSSRNLNNNTVYVSSYWFEAYDLFKRKNGIYAKHTLRDFYHFLYHG